MYPPLFVSDIKENNSNTKLCIDLCRVFTCIFGVCIIYLIFFTHVINEEMNQNYTLLN